MPEHLSIIPEGFVYKDKDALEAKICRFMEATASKIHFVFDFDRTLTVPHMETKADITSWNILRDHLPEEGQKRCLDLFTIYRAKELDGTMTKEDAVTWWSTILEIYTEYKLDLTDVENDFLNRASIRPGSRELFQICQNLNIPTVILSAGIKDVIDLWSSAYAISPTLVLSTVLKLDDKRQIIGWKRDSLVHVLNKAEMDHTQLTSIRNERPLAIVIGDSINDADMAEGEDTVLRVRILDPRPDEVFDIEQERAKTFERFDAAIETGDLQPFIDLATRLARKQA